jgi:hypothetical protein
VFCISDGDAVVLAGPAKDVALPTVCAIVARLPGKASNTIILIKFRMIRFRQFGIRSRGAGRRVIADTRRFLFTRGLV